MKLKKIKKGSLVEVILGADKGKKGEVLEILPRKLQVKVQGVRVQTHFDRKEGVLKREGYIDYSNVRFVSGAVADKKTGKKALSGRKSTGEKAAVSK